MEENNFPRGSKFGLGGKAPYSHTLGRSDSQVPITVSYGALPGNGKFLPRINAMQFKNKQHYTKELYKSKTVKK